MLTQFSFTIVDPQNKNRKKLVRSKLKVYERCTFRKREIKKGKSDSESKNNTFANQTIDENLVKIIVITVIVLCLVCSKKNEEDVSPVYNGGADLIVIRVQQDGNYENIEVSTRKREVDWGTIYGGEGGGHCHC